MLNQLCSEKECAPPFGDKRDCELNQDGFYTVKPLAQVLIHAPIKKRVSLKPCPKCGRNNKRTLPVKCYFNTNYKVRCMSCGFETDDFESKDAAHDAWNYC